MSDSRRSPRGHFIEKLGHYDPFLEDKKKSLYLDMNKLESWVQKGAQPTNRVKGLIKQYKQAVQN